MSDSTLSNEDVSGAKISLTFPLLFFGIGLESYGVEGTMGGGSTTFDYDVTMMDIYLDIAPMPFFNLVLGAGIGKGEFAISPASATYSDPTLTQVFFSLGYPFAGIFDAHLGYHVIKGSSDPTPSGNALDLDANMVTLGMKVGF